MHALYKSFLQVYVLNPKQDLHGLGFDPYKHAPEFRGNQFRVLYVANADVGSRNSYLIALSSFLQRKKDHA